MLSGPVAERHSQLLTVMLITAVLFHLALLISDWKRTSETTHKWHSWPTSDTNVGTTLTQHWQTTHAFNHSVKGWMPGQWGTPASALSLSLSLSTYFKMYVNTKVLLYI